MPRTSLAEAARLAAAVLEANRTAPAAAASVAAALVAAEAEGQGGHGLSRLPAYAAQARVGKIDGFAVPARHPDRGRRRLRSTRRTALPIRRLIWRSRGWCRWRGSAGSRSRRSAARTIAARWGWSWRGWPRPGWSG